MCLLFQFWGSGGCLRDWFLSPDMEDWWKWRTFDALWQQRITGRPGCPPRDHVHLLPPAVSSQDASPSQAPDSLFLAQRGVSETGQLCANFCACPEIPSSSLQFPTWALALISSSPRVPGNTLGHRGVQPKARGLHVAQDDYECGPTQNRKFT